MTLTGPVGAGNVTKLANQIMVACNIAAMGEALVLATKAGLDPEVVFNAVKGGLAGSTVLNAKAPMVIGAQLQAGLPHQAAPEGPAQRAAGGRIDEGLAAAHQPGAADADRADERRQGRPGSLGDRSLHRGPGGDRSGAA